MSRCYPYEGMGQPAVTRLASAYFEVQASVLRFGISEEQQRMGWNEVCNDPLFRALCIYMVYLTGRNVTAHPFRVVRHDICVRHISQGVPV
jgi:hypothetical protein